MTENRKQQSRNFYYQDFSYVIKAGNNINTWRDIVKKIIHPAGQAVFGEVGIVTVSGSEMMLARSLVTQNIKTLALTNSQNDGISTVTLKAI